MKKILYIEDEQGYVDIARESLKGYGYDIISASDGEEGMRKAIEEKPDLIYLDIFLPKVKGFELCERFKSDHRTKNIPILIITASGVSYLEEQCKNVGADDCVRKPYKIEELVAKTKILLKDI